MLRSSFTTEYFSNRTCKIRQDKVCRCPNIACRVSGEFMYPELAGCFRHCLGGSWRNLTRDVWGHSAFLSPLGGFWVYWLRTKRIGNREIQRDFAAFCFLCVRNLASRDSRLWKGAKILNFSVGWTQDVQMPVIYYAKRGQQ